MKIVAAVFADFERAPAGGPSQLRTELGGRSILARTLQRLARVDDLTARCLFVRPCDREVAERTLQSAGLAGQIELLPKDTAAHGRRPLITTARKWNLESWRGGLMGMTWFDEFVDAEAVALVTRHYGCDAVLCLDGHQPVFDPALAAAMLAHRAEHQDEAKIVFTQAPPGLAGVLLCPDALQDLLDLNVPLGLILSYRPELAQPDAITFPVCYQISPEIAHTAARLTGDTRRSRELLAAAFEELGDEPDAAALCNWLQAPGHDRAGPLPIEIELELTTADPLPNTKLRPRGDHVPRRALVDPSHIARLAKQLAEYDDRLVWIGGHGNPLQHPHFAQVCGALRSAGIFGIGVATPLFDLTDENLEALFAAPVDVVEVSLDAHSAGTYQRVHGVDGYERVVANVRRLEQIRRERHAPQPILVCSLTRCAETIAELESFYDDWIRNIGSALVRGYNDYCGLLPADTLLPTTPTVREPCRRLDTRLSLLADGVVALCSQDVAGSTPLGNWQTQPLRQIWQGEPLAQVRAAHAVHRLKPLPLCGSCREWGRP